MLKEKRNLVNFRIWVSLLFLLLLFFIGLDEETFNHPNVIKKAKKNIDYVVGMNT